MNTNYYVFIIQGETIKLYDVKKDIPLAGTGNKFYDAKVEIIKNIDNTKAGAQDLLVKLTFSDGSEKEIKVPVLVKEIETETKADKYTARRETLAATDMDVQNPKYSSINSNESFDDTKIREILKLDKFSDLGNIVIEVKNNADLSSVGPKTATVELKFDDNSKTLVSIPVNVKAYKLTELEANTGEMEKSYNTGDEIDLTKLKANVEVNSVKATVEYADFSDFGIKVVLSNGREITENPHAMGEVLNGNKIDLRLKATVSGQEITKNIEGLEVAGNEKLSEKFEKEIGAMQVGELTAIVNPSHFANDRLLKNLRILKDEGSDLTTDKVADAYKLGELKSKYGRIEVEVLEAPNRENLGTQKAKVKFKFTDKSEFEKSVEVKVVPIPVYHLSKAYSLNDADKNSLDISKSKLMLSVPGSTKPGETGVGTMASYKDYKYFGIEVEKKDRIKFINNSKVQDQELEADGSLILKVKVEKILNKDPDAANSLDFKVKFK